MTNQDASNHHTSPGAVIRFWRGGRVHQIPTPNPNQTLLEYLRSPEGLNARGTKEGCAEGDCGACTVVLAELGDETKPLKFRAINSCIRFTHQIDGCALWTVEDLSTGQGLLHPVQQALLNSHGSQCGFCTPGFVMSLFALYQNQNDQSLQAQDQGNLRARGEPVSREQAVAALSGNLCRCTGYRPILDAAQAMTLLPKVEQPEGAIKAALLALAKATAIAGTNSDDDIKANANAKELAPAIDQQGIFHPSDLATLLQQRRDHPQAQLIAGATDVGLWVTKQGRRFESVIDVTRTKELGHIMVSASHLEIGAAVRLEEAYQALVNVRPQVAVFARRFAGLPVRQSGTLGGNLANGSPIGDSMPLLISLGASIRLASAQRGPREMALEDFYLGYRRTALALDEVLTHILVPLPKVEELSRIYKVSKRFEDDISAVCIGIHITLSRQNSTTSNPTITSARIGVGGMAAIPSRARKTEDSLIGKTFSHETFVKAKESISREFEPLDDMRSSAKYRRQMAGNLLLRFWHEITQPHQINSLESLDAKPIVWMAQE
jgi:xanthine dehydrogenase small subunit